MFCMLSLLFVFYVPTFPCKVTLCLCKVRWIQAIIIIILNLRPSPEVAPQKHLWTYWRMIQDQKQLGRLLKAWRNDWRWRWEVHLWTTWWRAQTPVRCQRHWSLNKKGTMNGHYGWTQVKKVGMVIFNDTKGNSILFARRRTWEFNYWGTTPHLLSVPITFSAS